MDPVSLPAGEGSTEDEAGREEGQCHQEENVDEQEDKVFVAPRGRKLREDGNIGPVHGEDEVLNSNDVLHQAAAHGQAQHHQQGQGLPPTHQLHQVESMSQEAGEAEGEEDAEEEEAGGPRAAIKLDDESKGEAEDTQHAQQEEKLGRDRFPPVGVLHPADEGQETEHEGHRSHGPHCSHRF